METETQDDPQWHAIRLGTGLSTTSNSMVRCARSARAKPWERACAGLRDPQCQLHASDGYILRDTMYDYMLGMVSAGGVIDFGVLQGVPKQIVLTPQITFQTGYADEADHTDLQTQLATTRKFYDACMKPAAQARARVEEADHPDEPSALGGLEEQERAWKALTTPETVAARAWEQETRSFRAATLGSEAEDVSQAMPFFCPSRGNTDARYLVRCLY